MESDVYEVRKTEEKNEPVEISYYRPTFWKRAFCAIFDFLLAALLSLGFFTLTREIIINIPSYSEKNEILNTLKFESQLFVYSYTDERYEDIITYYNYSTNVDYAAIRIDLEKRIDNFHVFLGDQTNEQTKQDAIAYYNNFRLNIVVNDVHYFVEDQGAVVKNPDAEIGSKDYITKAYQPYIDNTALGLFSSKIPEVLEIEKLQSYMLFFVETPVGILFGCLIYYYIVPLILSRGKQTLGRFLFKIGLVDKNVLSVNAKLYTFRFQIQFFVEIILSIPTAGIPIIISFSLMAFSKKKQNLHDYFLNIQEIDCSDNKIFKNKKEAQDYIGRTQPHYFEKQKN